MMRPFPGFLLAVVLLSGIAGDLWAQKAAVESALPTGVKGTVLTFSGEVRPIVGLSSPVVGQVDTLTATLTELNAKTTDTEIRIELSADVLFDFDKADIKADAEPSLRKVATVIRSYPKSGVTIEGHTDAKGSDAYNAALSERRAASVRQWLESRGGVSGVRFAVRGLGAKRPVAPNTRPDGADDPEGRRKNRRVEIVVQKRA
jgi:outer membrane protein OmpA-like peptidoglycan-associated protein